MSTLIKHDGIVDKVKDGVVIVSINAKSACSGCHAKGACGGMDCLDKEVEVLTKDSYSVGEQVRVCISTAVGFKALFWGYLLPFLLLIGVIITAVMSKMSEDIAAILGLSATAFYYLLLYPMRHKLSKQFRFEIERA
ncbi:MAG: SoxR reducing system RseC family protein [Bacteriovoracaceae bacterium]|nr:SoxR reducing system RseC family protein [Bacteriovoracaceae bacterium]